MKYHPRRFKQGVRPAYGMVVNGNIEQSNEKSLSDSKLEKILNSEGIKISRRTIAKYRQQLGIENSYSRSIR